LKNLLIDGLSQDLKEYLDASGAHGGFILFSMGSHLNASSMPAEIRMELIKAFGSLKERVLWKWDEDTVEGLEEFGVNNVRVAKWLPQQDVLPHPNIKAFITHGGMLSIQESVYNGVPLIGLPVYGDQISYYFEYVSMRTVTIAYHQICFFEPNTTGIWGK
jgi:UDP:flavonoid glycosyltransferase YjiC (YdhE family)